MASDERVALAIEKKPQDVDVPAMRRPWHIHEES